MPNYYLAIDMGASSGRHILGSYEDGKLHLEEVYRFDNVQKTVNGHDCWDTEHLWNSILEGLKVCKALGKIPKSVGIDTWGVDFVLVTEDGQVIGDPVAYRDERTAGMDVEVEKTISFRQLYGRTGIQKASFNTIYQLMALKKEHPEQLQQADRLLFTPDYYNYKLTGIMANEYTIASTSGLLRAEDKTWDLELIGMLGLPEKIFRPLAMPGTVLGGFTREVQDMVGFNAQVVLPATHDTGSAFLAIPAVDEQAVYISSGTWSLLGVENPMPITTAQSHDENFSNEGGAWGRYRYLKNIMGLWMIQSVRRELNGVAYVQGKQLRTESAKKWSFQELIREAQKEQDFGSTVDVNKDRFLSPESMMEAIRAECAQTGQDVPENVGQIMQCIYNSLALCYRDAIRGLEKITGRQFTSINIVGGGCQDQYLNEMTRRYTGLPVYAGPVEGTAIGNLIVQMVSDGQLADLSDARAAIRKSFDIK